MKLRAWSNCLWLPLLAAPALARADDEFFERRIRPVLVEHCYPCHSATSEKLKGGLRLDTRDGLRRGGESGPAIVPGDVEASRLIQAVRYTDEHLQMPPRKGGGKLSAAQIADLETWVKLGAPDPRVEAISTLKSQTSNSPHWAFLPPQAAPLPRVKAKSWPQSPIDHFILAKLEANGLEPSPPADQRTLIRRATYDLIGLPPTLEEIDAFLRDKSATAFAKVVDRLLASPHYGERWGRHWLDVARYSDTKGYVYDREEKRFVHAHVYRDWVVRAFNRNLPYDEFLLAQIAGDQLPAPPAPATALDSPLAAMGFLTVGRRFLGVMHDIIDDRIDVLMRSTQGLSVGCARCHDHKFDPIPTRDYYSLYGVFHNSTEQTVPLLTNAPPTKEFEEYAKGLREREEKLAATFAKKRTDLTDRLRARCADYLTAVLDVAKLPSEEFYAFIAPDDLNPVIVRQWEAFLFKTREKFHPVFAPWHAFAALPAQDFAERAGELYEKFASIRNPRERVNPLVLQAFAGDPPRSMRDVAERYGRVFSSVDRAWRDAVKTAATNPTAPPVALDPNQEPIRQVLYGPDSPASIPNGAVVDLEWFFDEGTREALAKLQGEIDRWIIKSPGAVPHAVILADRPACKNTRVFVRGNPAKKGEEAPRQFLQVLAGPERQPFQHGSGRLELARAIASRDNPLTARVMVNRVWLHHFGAGLVRTPSDFGTRCEPPTHPELLDWLAVRFMADGWSVKQLHRLLMNSAAYRQGSSESVISRSVFSAASKGGRTGSLNTESLITDPKRAATLDPANRLLGRMNPQRLDFEAMRDSLLAVTGELDPAVGGKAAELFSPTPNLRRTIYGYLDRQFVPGVLRLFDFANPDLHIPQRSDTTVPQQALFFMNSPFVVERARALSRRPGMSATNPPSERINQLYRLVLRRPATARETDAGLNFIQSAATAPPPKPPEPVVTAWQYGFGAFDAASGRVTNFTALPHFTGDAWQGGPAWPDAKLGWVQLTAEGGHAGDDVAHAAISRWVAPRAGAVSISGGVRHEETAGDGIRARLVSSRSGLLGEWILHNQKAEAKADAVPVQPGDTLDFLVDIHGTLNSDNFKWSPAIKMVVGTDGEWSAKREFCGPTQPPPPPLSAWEQYAQVILLSNEFLFVD